MAAEPILEVRTCSGCGARLSRYNPDLVCAPCDRADRDRQLELAGQPRAGTPRASRPACAGVGPEFLEYRREHRLSQAQLAELLGLDQSYISKVENGLRTIRDVEALRRIADLLELPPERLGLASTPAGAGAAVTITITLTDMAGLSQAAPALVELLARLRPDAAEVGSAETLAVGPATAGSSRLRAVLRQRHWTYERFRRGYEQAAVELGLGHLTIGRRQFERWADGRVKTLPWPDACLVLEHLFGRPVDELLGLTDPAARAS